MSSLETLQVQEPILQASIQYWPRCQAVRFPGEEHPRDERRCIPRDGGGSTPLDEVPYMRLSQGSRLPGSIVALSASEEGTPYWMRSVQYGRCLSHEGRVYRDPRLSLHRLHIDGATAQRL